MSNLFDEIEQEKKNLPELKTVTSSLGVKRSLNVYQVVALVVLIVGIILGFLLGNMIPTCSANSGVFGSCTQTEFNVSLTLVTWLFSFLLALFIYALGHIISILESIDHNISELKK